MSDNSHTTLTKDDILQAFVEGAKFWEWHKTGATMWQSDQNLCLQKAKEKYGGHDAKA